MLVFGSEVIPRSFAEGASVIKNNIVILRVVAFAAAKDMNAYPLLSRLGGFVPDMPVAYTKQKFTQ